MNKELTVVTGLWNINRPGRDFNHYIEHFNKFLDIDANLFVYVPIELEHLVWAKRKKENTFVKVYSLEDVKKLYSPFWEKTQKIRTDPSWFNQTGPGGWLANSPQAVCEWYNPIVMSKMFMLHDVTIWDPFASKYFVWLDAGITNTVYEKYFTENKALDGINSLLDPFLFLCYPYHTNTEIHGFKKDAMDKFAQADVQMVGRGGLFGGTKQAIHEANGLYYTLVERSLSEGYMGTEESLFSIMTYLYPETYRRYMLDENGLIVKFVQELITKKPALEPVPVERTTNRHVNLDLTKIKTAIYILTFNFPQQLRTLLKSLEKHPEWLKRTDKILIDNSTDAAAKEENQKIAQEYGFSHYKHFDNVGICGGRQYAAEHFDTTDNDFYVFFEDDMCLHEPGSGTCRNGFRFFVPDLFDKIQKIMLKEKFDFLKLSFTEVYMDNHMQCSWYNVPQQVRTQIWPEYDKLPTGGLDPNVPRTKFNKIDVFENLAYIEGDVYYANWPLITSKEGNRKMFLNTKWAHPYEQTWMSHMFQETRKGNMRTAVLLASPVNHNRIVWYKPHERREN